MVVEFDFFFLKFVEYVEFGWFVMMEWFVE